MAPEARETEPVIQEQAGAGNCEKLAIAALAGAVAGALAGLLLAPDRGSETRRKLREGMTKCCAACRERVRPLFRCAPCEPAEEA